jgi:acetate kinase
MNVLVLNCGSSSLKYQLFDMRDESVKAKGLVERIGIKGSRVKHTSFPGGDAIRDEDIPDHTEAIKIVLSLLTDKQIGVLGSLAEISAVGHRVVHGGEKRSKSEIIDDSVIKSIQDCAYLAPLHNPANLAGIRAMQKNLPGVPNIAAFDTAFHQTLPPEAFLYGVPYKYYENDKVRRYSFHGTSHAFVSRRAAEILGRDVESLKLITCHLGNGSSITAVDGGRSVDSSLGFGTSPGVLMGTRCGDIDSAVALFLANKEGIARTSDILNKESGILGISGVSSDLRDVVAAAREGSERAALAVKMLTRSVAKHIAGYAAVMGGADAVAFTAGIGENSDIVRAGSLEKLEFMGIKIDAEKNKTLRGGEEGIISSPDSKVKVLVVPTNEELMIARDTLKLSGRK